MIRDIVSIDEELCNGCGECVPACAEGAIRIVSGKAKLLSDRLCDGLGACLGHCPQGAIRIERRKAAEFDEAAAQHQAIQGRRPNREAAHAHPPLGMTNPYLHAGCPSSRLAQFEKPSRRSDAVPAGCPGGSGGEAASELTHWPVQLRLLPSTAPVLSGARLLVAADCVPVAYAGFHSNLLRDHAVVIACPKLDDPRGYIEKLAEMISSNELTEITVAHMEVPCCMGILHTVLEARRLAGSDIPVNEVVISIRGQVMARRQVPAEAMAAL
jgi:Fe-S-cluster-containing hydrogenase component 2